MTMNYPVGGGILYEDNLELLTRNMFCVGDGDQPGMSHPLLGWSAYSLSRIYIQYI